MRFSSPPTERFSMDYNTPPEYKYVYNEDSVLRAMEVHSSLLRKELGRAGDVESGSSDSASSSSSSPEAGRWRFIGARRSGRKRLIGVWVAVGLGILVVSYLVIVWFLPSGSDIVDWGNGKGKGKADAEVGYEAVIEAADIVDDQDGRIHENATTAPASTSEHYPLPSASNSTGPYPNLRGVYPLRSDPSHVLVPITPLSPSRPLISPLTRPPHSLLSSYYITGQLPRFPPSHTPEPLDIVYLWVNSSSPYLDHAMSSKAETEGIRTQRGKAKRWRDNGELRGAMRSVKCAFESGLGKMHVITADVDLDVVEEMVLPEEGEYGMEVDGWRIGQIPDWFDWEGEEGGEVEGEIRWHFHSEVFRLPRDEDGSLGLEGVDDDEDVWRMEALPSFDSFEIETRLPWVQGLREHFILSNDDMFFMSPMSRHDFHHPLLGSVLRLDFTPSLMVRPQVSPDLFSTPGEWGGLQYANLLLSGRFPNQSRQYMHHIPKSLTLSMVDEVSVMFNAELTRSSTRGFRESKRGLADLEMAWLVGHFTIERWREALLWTWIVARMGGTEGVWGEEARLEMKSVLGLAGDIQDVWDVKVKQGERETLSDIEEIDRVMGWEGAKETELLWSSMDGHLPTHPGVAGTGTSCAFDTRTCLPSQFFVTPEISHDATEIFTHMTFGQPKCGDCLITALIAASGPRGLSAILPHEDQMFVPEQREKARWERSEPMLPLTSSWEGVDFSLDAVVRPGQDTWDGSVRSDGKVSLRDWSIKLLSRYVYLLGDTPTRFSQVHSTVQLDGALRQIDKEETIALVCINDDQPDRTGVAAKDVFKGWMKAHWGDVEAKWERRDEKW